MLFEEYMAWKNNNSSLEDFDVYFQHSCEGKDLWTIISELAYQIFELQTCVEGLIEDGQ